MPDSIIDQYFFDALHLLAAENVEMVSVLHPTPTTDAEFETSCRGLINNEWVYGEAGLGVTFSQVKLKASELEFIYNAQEYARNRATEYPPLADLADAMYWASKGDNTKLDNYYAACEAVKQKYPKS